MWSEVPSQQTFTYVIGGQESLATIVEVLVHIVVAGTAIAAFGSSVDLSGQAELIVRISHRVHSAFVIHLYALRIVICSKTFLLISTL